MCKDLKRTPCHSQNRNAAGTLDTIYSLVEIDTLLVACELDCPFMMWLCSSLNLTQLGLRLAVPDVSLLQEIGCATSSTAWFHSQSTVLVALHVLLDTRHVEVHVENASFLAQANRQWWHDS
jgi:hypothetical protein